MNLISSCCKSSIVPGTKQEYPLGGSTWYESFKVEVCEECGQEAEPIATCDMCGEPAEEFKKVNGDDYCSFCFNERLEEAVKWLKERTGLGA